MTLNNSKIIFIALSTVTLALLTGLFWALYIMKVKNEEAHTLLNEVDRITEAEILNKFVKTFREESQRDIAALDDISLTSDKVVYLIENIEAAGHTLGLYTEILSVEKVEDKKKVDPPIVSIEVETQGAWQDIYSFLHAMEALPQRVIIDKVSFSKDEEYWQSRILVSVYSFD